MHIGDIVDLDRYPVHAAGTPAYRELAARAAAALQATGACELPGFLTPAGVERAVREAGSLAHLAYPSSSRATVYLGGPDESLGPDHARNIVMSSSVRVIASDDVPASDALHQLYAWEPLLQFLADVLGLPRLYRYADPLGALNVAVMGDGDALGWHFDQTDFVTSLALVPAEHGGDFEYHPLIRNEQDECFDAVGAVLRGERSDAVRLPMTPGTFLLFMGRHSLHRVTPIRGARDRVVALLAYDRRPGTDSTAELKRARYGRERPRSAPPA